MVIEVARCERQALPRIGLAAAGAPQRRAMGLNGLHKLRSLRLSQAIEASSQAKCATVMEWRVGGS